MPKRALPVAAIEVNPQFADRPGVHVEVIESPLLKAGDTFAMEVDKWREIPPLVCASPDIVRQQLTDLAELIANGRQVRDSVFLTDAAKRIAALRATLGL